MQLGRLISSFILDLDEASENLELELIAVLHMLSMVRSFVGVAYVASIVIAYVGSIRSAKCATSGRSE